MTRYRKRVEYVDAEQWFPGDPERDERLGISLQPDHVQFRVGGEGPRMSWMLRPSRPDLLPTSVVPGDWIVGSTPFDRFAVRARDFEEAYEPAPEMTA